MVAALSQSLCDARYVCRSRRSAAQPWKIGTQDFWCQLLLVRFSATAKAIRKIEKCNLHNEMDEPAESAGRLAPRDCVWTFLIGNRHSSNRSFIQPAVRATNIRNDRNTQYYSSPSPKHAKRQALCIQHVIVDADKYERAKDLFDLSPNGLTQARSG
jgi:hypothetical protein